MEESSVDKKIASVSFLLFFSSSLFAPNKVSEPPVPFSPENYVCYRVKVPLKVDGLLDEPSWRAADWTKEFVDIEGKLRPKPRLRTRVKMLWDERYFYIAAELEEPNLWATLTERDAVIYQDNDFEVFIDPDGDTHNYYELEINALETVWDLFLVKPYRDGGPAVHSWDINGLQSAVNLNGTLNKPDDKDKGWTVELAFPWEVLKECLPGRKPPLAGDELRVNFSRVEWKLQVEDGKYVKMIDQSTGKTFPEDNWVWSPQGIINMHYPERWGYVQLSDKIVGTTKESFHFRPEEKIKWALRRVYYRQWAYHAGHQAFARDLVELGFKGKEKELEVAGSSFPPRIQITDSLFEVSYKSESGERWHIRQDGLVWKD